MAEWKRPDNIPFPSVWRTFEGKKEINGIKQQYWVQDLTEEYYDIVIHHLLRGFMAEEPLNKYSNILEDKVSTKELVQLWRHYFKQKLALICLTRKESVVELVGFNLTVRTYQGENFDFIQEYKGETLKKIYGAYLHVCHVKDVYAELNIDAYLAALGLYVLPMFHGEGIGLEILKARKNLCFAVGLKASVTGFTSKISQKIAERAGFKDIVEVSYEDLEKSNPDFRFPGIAEFTKSLRLMYICYED